MKQYQNYNYRLYTEYIFGLGRTDEVGEVLKRYGAKKVMVVNDPFVESSGLLARVEKSIHDAGVETVAFGGIKPNPLRSHVNKGVEIAKAEKVDWYLGVGGGSTMDTAKAIAAAVGWGKDDWYEKFFLQQAPHFHVPFVSNIGVIPTIAASGSEGSISIMIMDDIDRNDKFGGGGPNARPKFCILDPQLTLTVPRGQTAAGAVDMFAHAFERYFYHDSDCNLSDMWCAGLMKKVMKYGPIALADPSNQEARTELMLSCTYSQNDWLNVGHADEGRKGGPHYFEGVLSGTFDCTHGVGIGIVMPAWLEYVASYNEKGTKRAAQFAMQVMGVEPDTENLEMVAKEGARRLRYWLKDMGMPSTLKEIGVTEKDMPVLLAHPTLWPDGTHHAFLNLNIQEIEEFYRSFLE